MSPKVRRLQRNLRRRRIAGVCAGTADYFGIEVFWVRLAVMISVFFSFSLTFWLYLALWFILPVRPETPVPDVSFNLRRELYKIDRLVRRVHRRLPARVADQIQAIFDAMKAVTGQYESTLLVSSPLKSAWENTRVRLPQIIALLLAQHDSGHFTAELEGLEKNLRDASRQALEQELSGSSGKPDAFPDELIVWQRKIAPLREQLRDRARPQTLAVLERIEDKLAFLIRKSKESSELYDMRPVEVRNIAFEYVPNAIQKYLELPADMARTVPLRGGVTAEDSLTEQLIRLDHALEELATSLFERDAQALIIHARFLRDKFTGKPFTLPEKDMEQKIELQ